MISSIHKLIKNGLDFLVPVLTWTNRTVLIFTVKQCSFRSVNAILE